jgi:hypothetical protein
MRKQNVGFPVMRMSMSIVFSRGLHCPRVPRPCQWQFSHAIGNPYFWKISSISVALATMSFVIVPGINTRVLGRRSMEMRGPIERVQKSVDNYLQPVATDRPGGDRLAHLHSPILRSAKLLTAIFGSMSAKLRRSQIQGRIVRFEAVLTVAIGRLIVASPSSTYPTSELAPAIMLDVLNAALAILSHISDSFFGDNPRLLPQFGDLHSSAPHLFHATLAAHFLASHTMFSVWP